jgi:hypothetical protein
MESQNINNGLASVLTHHYDFRKPASPQARKPASPQVRLAGGMRTIEACLSVERSDRTTLDRLVADGNAAPEIVRAYRAAAEPGSWPEAIQRETLAVKAWLAQHPRVKPHVIATSSSWLNLVERLFAEITRQ